MTTSTSLPGAGPGRTWAWIAAAAVIVVATVGIVVVFGVERPPDLEPVDPSASAAPDASVAWTRFESDGPCVSVVRPDGSGGEIACGLPDGRLVGWDDSGLLLESFRDDPELAVLDPSTGEVVRRESLDGPARADLREVTTRRPSTADGATDDRSGAPPLRVEARDDGDAVVAVIDAGPGYDVRFGAYAPDGDWVALIDTAGRLLAVPVDGQGAGTGPPRLWHDDVDASQLVWEGTQPHVERP